MLGAAAPAHARVDPACDKTWDGTTGDWSDGSKWSPAGAPSPSQRACLPGGAYTVTVSGPTSPGGVTVGAGATVVVDSTNPSDTYLDTRSGASLINRGTIQIKDGSVVYANTTTNEGTIEDTGTVGVVPRIEGPLDNTGTIRANLSLQLWPKGGTLTNAAGGTLATAAVNSLLVIVGTGPDTTTLNGQVSNAGTLVTSNGILHLGSVTATGQPIVLSTGSLDPSGSGSAHVRVTSTVELIADIAAGFDVTVYSDAGTGGNLRLGADRTNNGTLTMESVGSAQDVSINAVSGTPRLNNAGTLNVKPGDGGNRFMRVQLTNTAAGNVHVFAGTVLTTDATGGASHTNAGDIVVDATGGFNITSQDAASFTQTAGTITVNGSFLQTAGTHVHQGGSVVGVITMSSPGNAPTLDPSGPGAVTYEIHGTSHLGSDIHSDATVHVLGAPSSSTASLDLTADRTNHGLVRLDSDGDNGAQVITAAGGSLTNAADGTLEILPGGGGARALTRTVNQGFADIRASTTAIHNNSDANVSFVNSGTVELDPAVELRPRGGYQQTGGSIDLDNASIFVPINPGFTDIQGGVLKGSGTIGGPLRNASEVSPGRAAAPAALIHVVSSTWQFGTLNQASYTQTAAGILAVDVNGTTAGTSYDQLEVDGPVTLDGTLEIATGAGFTPNASLPDRFTVVKSDSAPSGTFGTVAGEDSGPYTVRYGDPAPDAVVLQAGGPPAPTTRMSIDDAETTEGNAGTKSLAFTVRLNEAATSEVAAHWQTVADTATAPSDFVAVADQTVTFAPGETQKTINVTVNGDTAAEPIESFLVRLRAPSDAVRLGDARATGRILSDDFAITSVRPAAVGDGGASTFTVRGGDFVAGSAVRLQRAGSPNRDGEVLDIAADRSRIVARFDMTDAAHGAWDLVVTKPGQGGASATADDAVTVVAGAAPRIAVSVTAPAAQRTGWAGRATVSLRNEGLSDAGIELLRIFGTDVELSLEGDTAFTPDAIALNSDDLAERFGGTDVIPAGETRRVVVRFKSTTLVPHATLKVNAEVYPAGHLAAVIDNPISAQHDEEIGEIRGTVRTAGGEPVPGVPVTAIPHRGLGGTDQTGADGTFSMVNLDDGVYEVGVGDEGQAGAARTTVTITPSTRVHTVPLTADVADLAGTVRRPDGQRLAGASVYLVRDDTTIDRTQADGSGAYRFAVVRSGVFDLVAVHPSGRIARLEGVDVTAGTPHGGTTLEAGDRRLEVTVNGPGGPIENARVRLTRNGLGGAIPVVVTDASGVATFPNIPGGDYYVEARAPGLATNSLQSGDLGAGTTTRTLNLATGGTLSGAVSKLAQPLPRAMVIAVARDSGRAARALTDDSGHYTIDHAEAGTYDVWFTGFGVGAKLIGNVAVTQGATTTLNTAMTDTGVEPRFALNRPGGGHQFGALFTIRHVATGAELDAAFAVGDGVAKLGKLPPGEYEVSVTLPGAQPQTHPFTIGTTGTSRRRRVEFNFDEYDSSPWEAIPHGPDPSAGDRPWVDPFSQLPQPELDPKHVANWHLAPLTADYPLPCPKAARLNQLIYSHGRQMTAAYQRWVDAWSYAGQQASNDMGLYLSQAGVIVAKGFLSVRMAFDGPPPGMTEFDVGLLTTAVDQLALREQKLPSEITSQDRADTAQQLTELVTALMLERGGDQIGKGVETFAKGAGSLITILNALRDIDRFKDDVDKLPDDTKKRGDAYQNAAADYKDRVLEMNGLVREFWAAVAACPGPDDGKPKPGGSGGAGVDNRAPNDPNDMLGPAGVGAEGWIPRGQDLPYTIRFENLGPGSEHIPAGQSVASAPAVLVTIEDTLDDDVDIDAVELGDVGWGDVLVSVPPGLTSYHDDITQAGGDIVRVDGALDKATRKLTWTLASIDPETGEQETAADKGFLPPAPAGDPTAGQGFVSYGARGEDGLAHGTEIKAKATIRFDVNPPIDTPEHTNTVDATAPTSSVTSAVQPDPAGAGCLEQIAVQWSGSDVGAGLTAFDVWVAEDTGPYEPWRTDTSATSDVFPAEGGHTYKFRSVARDAVGNDEAPPAGADVERLVSHCDDTAPIAVATIDGPAAQGGWHPAPVEVDLEGIDDPGGFGVNKLIWSATGASPGGATVNADTTTLPAGDGVTEVAFAARDAAGNQSDERTVTVKVDAGDPTIDLRAPADGAQVNLGDVVTADFSCADARSGVADCTGSVPNGAALDTGAPGPHTFTVTATDKAGHSATITRSYTVAAPDGGTPTPPGGGGGTTPPPPTPPGPAPRAFSRPPLTVTVAKVAARKVTLKLVNKQAFAITGRVRLAAATGRKRALAGARAFSLASSARGTVVLKLNAAGRRALRSRRPVRVRLAFDLRAGTLRASFAKSARLRLKR
jgi:hypothetical protein